MITPNTDSTFIQVKSIKTWNIYQAKKNCAAAEVIEMTTQPTVQKSSASYNMKGEGEVSQSENRRVG